MAGTTEGKRAEWIKGPMRTIAQVAKRFGVSRQTVIRWFDEGTLHGVNLTPNPTARKRLLRFYDDDIDQLETLLTRKRAIVDASKIGQRA